MPHFRFIGDPKQRNAKWKEDHPGYQANDPASITFFATRVTPGIKFVLNGEAVEVSDGDRAARLRGNPHFEEVGVEQLGSGNGHSAGGDGGFPGTQSADLDSPPPVPKKRGPGRPKGSKNKNVGQRPAARPE